MSKQRVLVKRLHEDAVLPKYAREGDAGFDLYATEDVTIEPGQTMTIPTGLAFAIPKGYELQVRPRSGVSAKSKLRVANSPGTIDSGYRGEVGVIVDNVANLQWEYLDENYYGARSVEIKTTTLRDMIDGDWEGSDFDTPEGTIFIRKGDRIAQAVITEVPAVVFEEVTELDETERGAGGFGSTGVR